MKKWGYRITKHPATDFVDLVYFCSPEGECHLEKVPNNQAEVLEGILSDMGAQGWELIQLAFGRGGIIGFWKREWD